MTVWAPIEAEVSRINDYERWKERVLTSRKEGYQLLLAAGHQALTDETGTHVPFEEANRWLSENSPIPPFTVHRQAAGKGKLIGGMFLSGRSMGRDVADLVRQVLVEERSPADVPIVYQNTGQLIFSRHELENWGLSVKPAYRDNVQMVE